MEIAIVGCGFIGSTVAQAAQGMDRIGRIYLFDRDQAVAHTLAESIPKAAEAKSLEHVLDRVSLVVEAASQEAVRELAPVVLARGKDILILSVGALVDDPFRAELEVIGGKTGGRVYVTSGAVAGIDGVSAARQASLSKVLIRTTKTGTALDGVEGPLREPRVIFSGSAREAAQRLPRNVNVAATLGLAAGDLDGTRVEVVADPRAQSNQHEIEVEGRFGSMRITMTNAPSLTNPRTSYLAALAAIDLLRKYASVFWIGN